ncbi:RsmD family RNA methyltransferase [Actinobacteria bacterium YIM 96077]|uniref:16S rRNA (Guanine(966)-N(2))-methyltransferase RsmD n=1 Tax=Phytoactinopolyspora halophila TaxID=1981511 RepID=A0A329QE72_9ACTN|nr:RsmD family RNA methyltransferase [Phytoactinopolyspora halophila]AYY12702.1 RsmD family RNA methyltransferase [Actinobacteria bacterium YIM 96077]RAW10616.1 16S rRNA (guanine(966)-N(2))-methyltransferase RsmD [Phytoactinopolyspora halophila]
MTRIVGGSARGRRLRVPSGSITRPMTDRVREAMFSSLESMFGGLEGLHILDLYAGSGAIGLEGLSRGAARATLVESDAGVVRTIRSNAQALGLPGATVVHGAAERVLVPDTRSAAKPDARPDGGREARHADGDPASSGRRGGVEVYRGRMPDLRYDLVVADPPYALDSEILDTVLAHLASRWLAPDAVVVVERRQRSAPVRWPTGLTELRERAYGETVLWYGHSAGTQ